MYATNSIAKKLASLDLRTDSLKAWESEIHRRIEAGKISREDTLKQFEEMSIESDAIDLGLTIVLAEIKAFSTIGTAFDS